MDPQQPPPPQPAAGGGGGEGEGAMSSRDLDFHMSDQDDVATGTSNVVSVSEGKKTIKTSSLKDKLPKSSRPGLPFDRKIENIMKKSREQGAERAKNKRYSNISKRRNANEMDYDDDDDDDYNDDDDDDDDDDDVDLETEDRMYESIDESESKHIYDTVSEETLVSGSPLYPSSSAAAATAATDMLDQDAAAAGTGDATSITEEWKVTKMSPSLKYKLSKSSRPGLLRDHKVKSMRQKRREKDAVRAKNKKEDELSQRRNITELDNDDDEAELETEKHIDEPESESIPDTISDQLLAKLDSSDSFPYSFSSAAAAIPDTDSLKDRLSKSSRPGLSHDRKIESMLQKQRKQGAERAKNKREGMFFQRRNITELDGEDNDVGSIDESETESIPDTISEQSLAKLDSSDSPAYPSSSAAAARPGTDSSPYEPELKESVSEQSGGRPQGEKEKRRAPAVPRTLFASSAAAAATKTKPKQNKKKVIREDPAAVGTGVVTKNKKKRKGGGREKKDIIATSSKTTEENKEKVEVVISSPVQEEDAKRVCHWRGLEEDKEKENEEKKKKEVEKEEEMSVSKREEEAIPARRAAAEAEAAAEEDQQFRDADTSTTLSQEEQVRQCCGKAEDERATAVLTADRKKQEDAVLMAVSSPPSVVGSTSNPASLAADTSINTGKEKVEVATSLSPLSAITITARPSMKRNAEEAEHKRPEERETKRATVQSISTQQTMDADVYGKTEAEQSHDDAETSIHFLNKEGQDEHKAEAEAVATTSASAEAAVVAADQNAVIALNTHHRAPFIPPSHPFSNIGIMTHVAINETGSSVAETHRQEIEELKIHLNYLREHLDQKNDLIKHLEQEKRNGPPPVTENMEIVEYQHCDAVANLSEDHEMDELEVVHPYSHEHEQLFRYRQEIAQKDKYIKLLEQSFVSMNSPGAMINPPTQETKGSALVSTLSNLDHAGMVLTKRTEKVLDVAEDALKLVTPENQTESLHLPETTKDSALARQANVVPAPKRTEELTHNLVSTTLNCTKKAEDAINKPKPDTIENQTELFKKTEELAHSAVSSLEDEYKKNLNEYFNIRYTLQNKRSRLPAIDKNKYEEIQVVLQEVLTQLRMSSVQDSLDKLNFQTKINGTITNHLDKIEDFPNDAHVELVRSDRLFIVKHLPSLSDTYNIHFGNHLAATLALYVLENNVNPLLAKARNILTEIEVSPADTNSTRVDTTTVGDFADTGEEMDVDVKSTEVDDVGDRQKTKNNEETKMELDPLGDERFQERQVLTEIIKWTLNTVNEQLDASSNSTVTSREINVNTGNGNDQIKMNKIDLATKDSLQKDQTWTGVDSFRTELKKDPSIDAALDDMRKSTTIGGGIVDDDDVSNRLVEPHGLNLQGYPFYLLKLCAEKNDKSANKAVTHPEHFRVLINELNSVRDKTHVNDNEESAEDRLKLLGISLSNSLSASEIFIHGNYFSPSSTATTANTAIGLNATIFNIFMVDAHTLRDISSTAYLFRRFLIENMKGEYITQGKVRAKMCEATVASLFTACRKLLGSKQLTGKIKPSLESELAAVTAIDKSGSTSDRFRVKACFLILNFLTSYVKICLGRIMCMIQILRATGLASKKVVTSDADAEVAGTKLLAVYDVKYDFTVLYKLLCLQQKNVEILLDVGFKAWESCVVSLAATTSVANLPISDDKQKSLFPLSGNETVVATGAGEHDDDDAVHDTWNIIAANDLMQLLIQYRTWLERQPDDAVDNNNNNNNKMLRVCRAAAGTIVACCEILTVVIPDKVSNLLDLFKNKDSTNAQYKKSGKEMIEEALQKLRSKLDSKKSKLNDRNTGNYSNDAVLGAWAIKPGKVTAAAHIFVRGFVNYINLREEDYLWGAALPFPPDGRGTAVEGWLQNYALSEKKLENFCDIDPDSNSPEAGFMIPPDPMMHTFWNSSTRTGNKTGGLGTKVGNKEGYVLRHGNVTSAAAAATQQTTTASDMVYRGLPLQSLKAPDGTTLHYIQPSKGVTVLVSGSSEEERARKTMLLTNALEENRQYMSFTRPVFDFAHQRNVHYETPRVILEGTGQHNPRLGQIWVPNNNNNMSVRASDWSLPSLDLLLYELKRHSTPTSGGGDEEEGRYPVIKSRAIGSGSGDGGSAGGGAGGGGGGGGGGGHNTDLAIRNVIGNIVSSSSSSTLSITNADAAVSPRIVSSSSPLNDIDRVLMSPRAAATASLRRYGAGGIFAPNVNKACGMYSNINRPTTGGLTDGGKEMTESWWTVDKNLTRKADLVGQTLIILTPAILDAHPPRG